MLPETHGAHFRQKIIELSKIVASTDERAVFATNQAREAAFATDPIGHVWTAPAVQEESEYQRSVRVRSCIRPLSAAVWPLALM
jgi:hypothetical protein